MAAGNFTSLKARALHAGSWSIVGYGLAQVVRLGSNLVMTRLLVPEMFGVMAIATMVGVILWLLADLGVHQNIVQSNRGDDPAFLDTAWSMQIVRGFLLWLFAILVSIALYVASLHGLFPSDSVYASPELPLVIATTSFGAVFLGFSSTGLATAQRKFNQRRVNEIALVSQIAATAVMIVIGLIHKSIWALVVGSLVNPLTTAILSHAWMDGHKNRFRIEREALRELVHFGKWMFVSSVVSVLAANGDRLLLGGIVSARLMGFYAIAAMLVASLQGALAMLLESVVLPVASEVNRTDPARMREIYYKLRVPSDLLVLGAAGFLFALGELLIRILYDARYAAAGDILRVLALSLTTLRYSVANKIYIAVGIPKYQAIVNGIRLVALYALVPVLYSFWGFRAAIWGIALHALATMPAVYYFNGKLGLNDAWKESWVLVALPVGYVLGLGVEVLFT